MFTQYFVISLYLSSLGLLGFLASRKLRNMDDFFTGGKSLGFWITALSTQATGESAWLLLGLTGLAAIVGVSAFWVVIGEFIGVFIAWFLLAPLFKKKADQCQARTTTDYLLSRFPLSGKPIRWLSVISLVCFCTIYAAAEIDATGTIIAQSLGWNYFSGAAIGFLIVTLYCTAGGFLAVAWTDCVQGIMMMCALLMLPLIAWFSLTIPDGLISTLQSIDPDLLNLLGPGDPVLNSFQIIGFLAIGLGFIGTPHIFARFIAVKDGKEIRKGRWVAIVYTLITDTTAVVIGLTGRCIYTRAGMDAESILGNGGQHVMPMLTDQLLPPLLIGFYIAAILAAIMSTFSSLLLLASSAVSCDWFCQKGAKKLSPEKEKQLSRFITWILAFCALILAFLVTWLSPTHTIFWFAVFGMSGITATFSPAMILGLLWPNYSSAGAVASMATGFLTVLAGKFWLQHIENIGPYFSAMESLPPAFLLSLLTGWIFSIIKPDRSYTEKNQSLNISR